MTGPEPQPQPNPPGQFQQIINVVRRSIADGTRHVYIWEGTHNNAAVRQFMTDPGFYQAVSVQGRPLYIWEDGTSMLNEVLARYRTDPEYRNSINTMLRRSL